MATTELTIHLPKPHRLQRAIRESGAKRNVISAGRRAGKTTLAAMVAVEKALEKRRVLLASPTQYQADAFWEKCKAWCAEPISAGIIKKNESLRSLEFPTGGRIRAKTAWDADTLRGDYADFLVLDEFALMASDAWDLVGAPMLLDNDGDAWFISTPRRKNHFHKLFLRGQQDDERWKSWHFTSHENPHLSKLALDEITQDLTEEGYKQEILAEFLESEGAVFRNIAACLHAPKDVIPRNHEGHYIIAGVDWGKHQDFTAISIVCATCKQEVALDRFNQINYTFQRGRLAAIVGTWNVRDIHAELNAMGEPIVDQLQHEGLPVRGFQMTPSSKPPLIESMALAVERGECQWLDVPVATVELEAYERKVSPTTGRSAYSAPEGMHDDTVVARALAWDAIVNRPIRPKTVII
jgi:hypothetical protein